MANSADDEKRSLSRRELLKRVGIAGAVVSVPPVLLPSPAFPAQAGSASGGTRLARRWRRSPLRRRRRSRRSWLA